MRGIYVHIPFCVKKCSYCDFYSIAGNREAVKEFPRLLAREMDLVLEKSPGEAAVPADTVFFGGGTPTVLGAEALCGILDDLKKRFPLASDAEVTTEANPGTVTAEDFRTLRTGGFNRVSIGVQSFDPRTLRTLGRIHGSGEVRTAHRDARRTGFTSIGFDLIFGIPGQKSSDWRNDLDTAVTFLPAHVSSYALAPERGTPIHGAIDRGELRMPDDDAVAEMYEETRRVLSMAGYRHYEISNFARPGAECRHNIKYWRREGYLGLGPSAHGLIFPRGESPFGMRTANPPSLAVYRSRIEEGFIPWTEERACTLEDAWKESLIAGLRMLEGIDRKEVENRYGPPPENLRKAVESVVRAGKLAEEGARLLLPQRLLFISNEVLQALV
ncbi:MAG: radical SAM family heme chaperone HemW [Deltaproteobacteria bacterium]|nr:radical SAM family heme chaperone HemW [Deltaproteobacteria bacterium]